MKYDNLIGFLVMGWALHYFPFFIMQRQLFLHHYFPALYFSILTACAVFDLLTSTTGPRRRIQIAAFLMVVAIWNYAHFSPLAYGNPWTRGQCKNAQWLRTWDFACNDFLDNVRPNHPYLTQLTLKSRCHNIKPSPRLPLARRLLQCKCLLQPTRNRTSLATLPKRNKRL